MPNSLLRRATPRYLSSPFWIRPLSDVLRDKKGWGWHWTISGLQCQMMDSRRALRAIRSEFCNLWCRIRTLHERRYYRVAPSRICPESLRPRHGRLDACNSGIRDLKIRYSWASTIEEMMFLEGFERGERFAYRSLGTPEKVPFALSYPHEEAADNDTAKAGAISQAGAQRRELGDHRHGKRSQANQPLPPQNRGSCGCAAQGKART